MFKSLNILPKIKEKLKMNCSHKDNVKEPEVSEWKRFLILSLTQRRYKRSRKLN
jgi:hypothetical protein